MSAAAAGAVPVARSSAAARWAQRIRFYAPAVLVFVGGIVAWELIVGALNLQKFILPKPTAIVAALNENLTSSRFNLLASAQATLVEALGGLAIGTVAGVAVAFATARWATCCRWRSRPTRSRSSPSPRSSTTGSAWRTRSRRWSWPRSSSSSR